MANMREIADALKVLINSGTKKKKDITILHANTAYPTPYERCKPKGYAYNKK